jgi:drug/metabolite transporter (DMT)-like permease
MNSQPLRAALWMGAAVLCFSVMAVSVRELLAHMGVFEILFLRTLVTLLLVLGVAARAGRAPLRTQRFWTHFWRAMFHLGGQWCWMYAIGVLTLAMVFAIEFTMPVWVAVLAVFFLGERLNAGRVVMLALGLAGIGIILRPGVGAYDAATLAGALLMLLGSVFYAGNMIMTKRLSSTDAPLAVIFWMSVIQTPITLATAAPEWVAPHLADLPWILAIGTGSFVAHYSLTRAMKLGDATLIVPIDFLRLPLIAVVGAVFYAEPLEAAVFIGAAVIFAGTYFSLVRETRVTRA